MPLPSDYYLRQRLNVASQLNAKLHSKGSAAAFDAYYESRLASFFDRLVAELVGSDLPSFIGKALRIWLPIWGAYTYGILEAKPEAILAVFAFYMVVFVALFFRRQSRRKQVRADETLTDPSLAEAAKTLVAAMQIGHLALEATGSERMKALDDSRAAIESAIGNTLQALKVPRWRVDWWRFTRPPTNLIAAPASEPLNDPNAAVSTERVLRASARRVFAAFEQADQLARWWGPKDFTNTFERFEFEPGGRWVFVMHGPNGANFPNESVFREIEPDARIVIEHVVKPWYMLTVTLTARGDDTHLAWVQEFESPEFAARMRPLSGTANEQVLDRLQALLAGA